MLAKLDKCFSNRVENAKYLRYHHLNKGFVSVGSHLPIKSFQTSQGARNCLRRPGNSASVPSFFRLRRAAWAFLLGTSVYRCFFLTVSIHDLLQIGQIQHV